MNDLSQVAQMTAPEPMVEGPQPLMREIQTGAPYPLEALGQLRAVVEAVEDKSEAPVALAAQSALATVSLAVQGQANVETLAGNKPVSLFFLGIAKSGERKSYVVNLLTRGLREHEREAEDVYKAEFADHLNSLELWKSRRGVLLKKASGHDDKARLAETDLRRMGAEPEPPQLPNRTAPDPTLEGLIKLYMVGNPSLGVFTDEAGGLIGGHAMNSDNRLKTCAGLSSIWDSGTINRTRAGDGAKTMRDKRLTCDLMAQPIAVAPLLADPIANGQGFLARFLMTEPQSNIGYRMRDSYSPQSDNVLEAFNTKLKSKLGDTPEAIGLVSLAGGARKLLREYYQATEAAQRPEGLLCNITAHASKSPEQAARIAGCMALWNNQSSVDAQTMANAITLADYYLAEAKRLADHAVISQETQCAEQLRKWIFQSWPHEFVTVRNVTQLGPNALREAKVAKACIRILADHGWLIAMPEGHVVDGIPRNESWQKARP